MNIKTESIKILLEDKFNKNIQEIKIRDVLSVYSMTIDSLDIDNNKISVVFSEIKKFKNLMYLELCNLKITNKMLEVLTSLVYLEGLVFRNCEFVNDFSKITDLNIKSLKVYACVNFKFIYFGNVKTIESIIVRDTLFSSFNGLRKMHLKYFEIDNCVISRFCVNYLKVDNFIVSKMIYNKYLEMIDNFQSNIMVYADDGFYIEQVINNSRSVSLVG